jgi:SecD/SecF fusion protein
MENKLSVQIFTIALALASLYTLSFNWASKNFEETARTHGEYIADGLEQDSLLDGLTWDEAAKVATRKYLRDSVEVIAYEIPFFVEKSYREVKEEELNLGLDLRGGMSVTLEVSLPDLMIALSDYSSNEGFRNAISTAKQNQKNSTSGFMELFEEAWSDHVDNSAISDSTLWRIFHNMEQKDLFPAKSSDEEIFVILDRESETAIDNTESISESVSINLASLNLMYRNFRMDVF